MRSSLRSASSRTPHTSADAADVDPQQSRLPAWRAGRVLSRSMHAPDLACLLLLLQASMALVSSSLVLILAATGFPVPLGKLGGVGLIAVAHPILLVVLAIGVTRSWRGIRRAALIFESVTIAGTLANLALNVLPRVQTESGPLVLGVNLVLPATIVALLRTRRRLPSTSTLIATLLAASAVIHAALASAHAGEVPELGPPGSTPSCWASRRWEQCWPSGGRACRSSVAGVPWPSACSWRTSSPIWSTSDRDASMWSRRHGRQTGGGPRARAAPDPQGQPRGGACTAAIAGVDADGQHDAGARLRHRHRCLGTGFRPHHIPAAGEAAHGIEPVPGHSVRRKLINPVARTTRRRRRG